MASSSRSNSPYYKLYMKKKNPTLDKPDDRQISLLFIFCLSRHEPKAKIQRWTYAGITYGAWSDDVDNPLRNELEDKDLWGIVDTKQVEDPNSEVRKIIDLSPSDLDKHDEAYKRWLKAQVKGKFPDDEEKKRDPSEEYLDTGVTAEARDQWQNKYFKDMAHAKLATLLAKGLLR
ncbi:hypothetical protein V2A60_009814 [Cordyceps javanica]|uniref:Uncharacterized protein n=1 Tax=Cordyceps javanica TaxID=43265 RepID=A0A545VVF0_9HYPO|nr:hypothetical protein IF1G_06106 [Cordyceps javanica]TQW05677.1 hypothetical protein IF2G_06799 [Cordyceps javanica]